MPRSYLAVALSFSGPSATRRVHRRVPKPREFLVEQRDRDRATGHVQRGHVVAHERAHDPCAAFLEPRRAEWYIR